MKTWVKVMIWVSIGVILAAVVYLFNKEMKRTKAAKAAAALAAEAAGTVTANGTEGVS